MEMGRNVLSKEVLKNAIGDYIARTNFESPFDTIVIKAMEELLKYKTYEEQLKNNYSCDGCVHSGQNRYRCSTCKRGALDRHQTASQYLIEHHKNIQE